MTQKQLAELSGVTESALSHYIKGDRIPSGVTSVNVAYALSTTVNYILGKEDILDFSNIKRILEQNKSKMKQWKRNRKIFINMKYTAQSVGQHGKEKPDAN